MSALSKYEALNAPSCSDILFFAGVEGCPVGVIPETVAYQMCQRIEIPVRTVQLLHHIRDELAICLFLLPAPAKALQVQLVL